MTDHSPSSKNIMRQTLNCRKLESREHTERQQS
jgi:hypothetical protein